MAENFYTILTATGKAKLANSAVLGSKVNFKTLKVGDGKGSYYEPSENQTSLVNQVWSGNIGSISVDENNPNWIVIETLIPATIGGFFIREAGIFDEDDDLIAISKLSETYKPVVSEGSIKDLCIKIILEVSNVESVTLKIDPTVIVATKKDIANLKLEHNKYVTNLETEIQEIRDELSNDNIITQNLSYGMNGFIRNLSKNSISPKFNIQGKTLINLLGSDGNCENVGKWAAYQSVLDLDIANKVIGANGIKITINSTFGALYKRVSSTFMDSTKHYFMSAYVKNGNATNVQVYKDNIAGGNNVSSEPITDTSKFIRTGIAIKPADINAGNGLNILVNGANGQYAYCDGIMINEITSEEYINMTVDQLLAKYPYVDGYSCLTNPYAEIRHDNMVINGNAEDGIAWWSVVSGNPTLEIVKGKFKLTSTDTGAIGKAQDIPVKPNTNYYYKVNVNGSGNPRLFIENYPSITKLAEGTEGTFNSGSNNIIRMFMLVNDSAVAEFDSIMLIEGTQPPSTYKSCRRERVVLEGNFAEGDFVTYENGKAVGQINWKHKTLYGKDTGWLFGRDATGFKQLYLPNLPNVNLAVSNSQTVVKYNGAILVNKKVQIVDPFLLSAADQVDFDVSYINKVQLTVADTDTGWSESINPNDDEVKAFMNGWRAIAYNNYEGSNRYVAWKSVVDGTIANTYTTLASAVTNSNVIPVADASKFAVNDIIAIDNGIGLLTTSKISAISGNNITIGTTISWAVGLSFIKCDSNASSAVLTYCKNNVAPGYEGYRLHYKLQNPEPATDDNVQINGDVLQIDPGENYLFLDTGGVIGELATVYYDGTYDYINYVNSVTKCKTEYINTVYKNGAYDSWLGHSNNTTNGKDKVYILPTNFDTNATYTVDYKILATVAPLVGAVSCSYTQSLIEAVNSLQDQVNSRQVHDSIFDEIIDLSMYERLSNVGRYATWAGVNWLATGGTIMVQIELQFSVRKKLIPKITLNTIKLYNSASDIDITSKFNIYNIVVNRNSVKLTYQAIDSTTTNNIKTNGVYMVYDVTADCRDRA